MESLLRQQYGIPDSAVLIPKEEDLALRPGTEGLANVGFRYTNGSTRRICKTTGNHMFFRDDLDAKIKSIDHRWVNENGVFRPGATRHHITVDGNVVTYSLRDAGFQMTFPVPFQTDGDYLTSVSNGLTVRLFAKGAKFDKWVSGVGHPNLPIRNGNYVWSVPVSGLPNFSAQGADADFGDFKLRQAFLWPCVHRPEGKKKIPIRQRVLNGMYEKHLPVTFFEDGVAWETDATAYYAGAGDGYVSAGSATWATAHDALVGDAADATGTTRIMGSETGGGSEYYINRIFFPTDTSGIADADTISGALLYVYISAKDNDDNDGDDWLNVVQTSQALSTTLVIADWDQCGSISNPTEGATRIDLGSITTSAYNAWTLDATGRGWITKTGTTLLGMREGHDAINSAGPVGASLGSYATGAFSESSGTSNDPYLDVTSSAATSNKFLLLGVG